MLSITYQPCSSSPDTISKKFSLGEEIPVSVTSSACSSSMLLTQATGKELAHAILILNNGLYISPVEYQFPSMAFLDREAKKILFNWNNKAKGRRGVES